MAQLTLQPVAPQPKPAEPCGSTPAEPSPWDFAPASTLAHRALLHRVVQSPSFARSEKLASFLTFVCEMTLKGREREINEQKIGQAVFGRSRDYDSTVDGIVRTQASRVRQRLEQYFANEGAFEPVRIVIPRGGYVPLFEPRSPVEPAIPLSPNATPAPLHASVSASPRFGGRIFPWVLIGILSIALLVALLLNQGVLTIVPRSVSARHPLWSQLLIPGQTTSLIAADSGLVLYQQRVRKPINLEAYLRADYTRDAEPTVTAPTGAIKDPFALSTDQQYGRLRYTSVVDMEVAANLTRMALQRQVGITVRYARDLRPNDLKSGNVILLGAAEANPWVELFEKNMNYVFHDDFAAHTFSVYDKANAKWWNSSPSDTQHRVYAVVAFLPNLSGQGNVLILEGTSMAGTEAAWDFVADDAQLVPFLNQIRRPDGTLPHFEVLLENNNLSASAVRSTILGWRIAP